MPLPVPRCKTSSHKASPLRSLLSRGERTGNPAETDLEREPTPPPSRGLRARQRPPTLPRSPIRLRQRPAEGAQGASETKAHRQGDEDEEYSKEFESDEEEDKLGGTQPAVFSKRWHERHRGAQIVPRFEVPSRFRALYTVGFEPDSVEHFRNFGPASGASIGRASEASSFYATAAYTCIVNNSLTEAVAELAGHPAISSDLSNNLQGPLAEVFGKVSDAQVATHGVYELVAARYEVLCGKQGASGIADPDLLEAFIDPLQPTAPSGESPFDSSSSRQLGQPPSAQERKQPDNTATARVQRRLERALDQAKEVEEAPQPSILQPLKDLRGGAEGEGEGQGEEETSNASPPLSASRSGPPGMATHRCHSVACPPTALRVAAALEAPTALSADTELQAGAEARLVRCRGSQAVVGVRLRPSGNQGGTGEGHDTGDCVPRICDKRVQKVEACHRLLQSQRQPRRPDIPHGPTRGSSRGAEAQRRSISGGHKRRVLPSPHTKLRPRTPRIQGGGRGVPTAMFELWTVGGALVLHQGDETRGSSSAGERTSSLFVPRRFLRRGPQLRPSRRIGSRHEMPRGRDYRTIRQAGPAPAPTQVRLHGVKKAGDSRNCRGFRERAIPTQRCQVGKNRGTSPSAIAICRSAPPERTRDGHQEVCWPRKLRHTRRGGCSTSSARVVQLSFRRSRSRTPKNNCKYTVARDVTRDRYPNARQARVRRGRRSCDYPRGGTAREREQTALSRCHARPAVVGTSQLQLSRGTHTVANGRRGCFHGRKYVRLGGGLERSSSGRGVLRRAARGSSYQRARAARCHLRASQLRAPRQTKGCTTGHRLKGDRVRGSKHVVPLAAPSRSTARTPPPLRGRGRRYLHTKHTFSAQHVGGQTVKATRQSRMEHSAHRRTASRAPFLSSSTRLRRTGAAVPHSSVPRTPRAPVSGSFAGMGPLLAALGAWRPRGARMVKSKLVSELPATRGSRLQARPRINESLVERRDRLREKTQLRWEGEGSLAARHIRPHAVGSNTAAVIIGSAYASATQGNYQHLWETFQEYCNRTGLLSMPATAETICSYLGFVYDRGSVRGGSIRPYVAAVAAKHRTMGFPDPTTGGQVSQTRRGFRARDARCNYGPPQRSARLPASVASYALNKALAALEGEDLDCFRRFGLLALTFLLCARPGSTREL